MTNLLKLFTCRRAAIFLATNGVGVANVHLSFRVALAMSALAMAITIWGKLDGERERDRERGSVSNKREDTRIHLR